MIFKFILYIFNYYYFKQIFIYYDYCQEYKINQISYIYF